MAAPFKVGDRVWARYFFSETPIKGTVELLSLFQSKHPDIPLSPDNPRYRVRYDEPQGEFGIERGFYNAEDLQHCDFLKRDMD